MSFNSSPVLVAYLGGICVGFGVFSIFHYVIKEKKLEKANIYINKNKLVNYQLRIPFYNTKCISMCSVAAPKLMQSISNSLNEDDKNITMDRIDSFKTISKQSVTDIRQKVFEQYSEYAVSELLSDDDEEEEEEIDTYDKPSYLYRQKTRTHWSSYDLNNMENDMKKQLNMLKTQSESFINSNKPKPKNINNKRSLFRCKSSYKWDYEDVEINKKEMQEQIIYLIQISQ